MSRLVAALLLLLFLAVPLLGEAACDDCTGEPLDTSCVTCSLCLCCGQTWALRADLSQIFALRSSGPALDAQLAAPHAPAPREILHIPLA